MDHGNARLTDSERAHWEREGFVVRRGFAEPGVTKRMLDEVIARTRAAQEQALHDGAVALPEANLASSAAGSPFAEDRLAKLFKIHRHGVFREFIESPAVMDIVESLLGPRIDCFLSQFIFKNPGAWGQPWHQDALYFPFDRMPQVGLWLAVSEATLENGALHVLPGSHREPLHEHIRDRRPGANYGYMEIVDHEMSAAVPVLMQPGDLLVFHSLLMHCSRDNLSQGRRAAMVYHCAERGTVDRSIGKSAVIDWMELHRRSE